MYSDSLWQDFLCTRMTFSQKESKPPFNLGTFPFWVKMQTQTLSATEFSFSSSSSLKCWRQQLFEFSLECQCQRNFLSRIRFPTFLPSQCREDWKKGFFARKLWSRTRTTSKLNPTTKLLFYNNIVLVSKTMIMIVLTIYNHDHNLSPFIIIIVESRAEHGGRSDDLSHWERPDEGASG